MKRYDPDVILVMPCSFTIARTVKKVRLLAERPGWAELSAIRNRRVFAVQGSLFHRPGPRLAKGLRLMAALFHPEYFRSPSIAHAKPLL